MVDAPEGGEPRPTDTRTGFAFCDTCKTLYLGLEADQLLCPCAPREERKLVDVQFAYQTVALDEVRATRKRQVYPLRYIRGV